MDGKLEDINDYKNIEKLISETGAKVSGELATELIKVGANSLSISFSLSLSLSLSLQVSNSLSLSLSLSLGRR
jgi:hypothetical protein